MNSSGFLFIFKTTTMELRNFLKENWAEIEIKLKAKYPQLNEGDLNYIEGYESEFFHNLQMKTGKSEERLLQEMNAMAEK